MPGSTKALWFYFGSKSVKNENEKPYFSANEKNTAVENAEKWGGFK